MAVVASWGRSCAQALRNALTAWFEAAAAVGSGCLVASAAGGGGRPAADQRRRRLVRAGVVLGLCPRGSGKALAAWVADQRSVFELADKLDDSDNKK